MDSIKGDELPKITTRPPGPNARKILERDKQCFSFTRRQRFYPLVIEGGRNAVVKDVDGNLFLDFIAGDYNLGPSPPEVVEAINKQIEKLLLFMEPAGIWENYVRFAEKLKELAPGELKNGKILYPISGSETNEFAVDCARFCTRKSVIIDYQAGFHGTTPGVKPFTAIWPEYKGMYKITDVVHIPYPYCYRCVFGQEYPQCNLRCVEYLNWIFDTVVAPNEIAAIFTETIQSPGGVIIPPKDYWPKVYEICRKNEILIIDDEILVGTGRTGKMFAIEHWGLVPDIITMGKSIAMGAPLSVMLGKRELMDKWPVGLGGQVVSFGGNPVGVAAGVAGLEILQRDNLFDRVTRMGEYLLKRLQEMAEKYEIIGEVRGLGLNAGIELVKDRKTKEPATKEAVEVCEEAFYRGLILLRYGIWNQVIRLYPVFTTTEEQFDVALNIIEECIKTVEARHKR